MISEKECMQLLEKEKVPGHIIRHSHAVRKVAMYLGKMLLERGVKVDAELVDRAALLHDICKIKFVQTEREPFHPDEGAKLLRKKGLDKIAEIVEAHGIRAVIGGRMDSWEKKLIAYADARVLGDRIVSMEERFEYLVKKYPKGIEDFRKATPVLKRIEREIFGDRPTDLGFLNE